MEYLVQVTCPHCETSQSKDFRDIENPMGCENCHKSFRLNSLKDAMTEKKFEELCQTIEDRRKEYYSEILEIKEDEVRTNAMVIYDILQDNPQGILIESLRNRVVFPSEFRNTINKLVALDKVEWAGSPGNEYLMLK